MYKSYLKNLIFFLTVFSIPILGNGLFLYNSGEFMSIEEIVDKQLASDQYSIVGFATSNHTDEEYKNELYTRLNPKVLVLGSSRVMQFRQDYFSVPMVNAGGVMSSVNRGRNYVYKAYSHHIPDLVILGLDYWWFHESEISLKEKTASTSKLGFHVSPRDTILPLQWLLKKKIKLSDYFKLMNPLNIVSNDFSRGIGVDGYLNKNGFAPDGSYIYTKRIMGKEICEDKSFGLSFERIEHGGDPLHHAYSRYFQYGSKINEAEFSNFVELIKMMEAKGSKVILFIPPLAPSVISKMEDYWGKYAYVNELRRKLEVAGLSYFDFHDPKVLSSSDCEFLDGYHGGEITYVKILQLLSKQVPELLYYLNEPYIASVTKNYQNLAMVPQEKLDYIKEVDFLGIGCHKSLTGNQFRT